MSNRIPIPLTPIPEHELVGFGSLDLGNEYNTDKLHPYIPLLAVNPNFEGLGHGTTIVQHLIDEAALLVCNRSGRHGGLYLDVYTTNDKAINLYTRCGFVQVLDPTPDPEEGGKTYIVMAKRVSIAAV